MNKKAQSTVEYMVLLGVIVAALVGMQVYLKRGMQGRIKGYTQQLSGDSAYTPGATHSFSMVTSKVEESSSSKDKISNSEAVVNQTTLRDEETLSFSEEPRRE